MFYLRAAEKVTDASSSRKYLTSYQPSHPGTCTWKRSFCAQLGIQLSSSLTKMKHWYGQEHFALCPCWMKAGCIV